MIKTTIEIKNENILKNLKYMKDNYHKEFIFVLKNNAYNTGLITTTKTCYQAGYRYFAVCTITEALQVREHAKEAFIFIMNPLDHEEILLAIENDFVINLSSKECFEKHQGILANARLHLKVNVGMNRFGFNDITEINDLINNNSNIEGLYTHFPVADLDDLTMHNQQVVFFAEIYEQITNKNQLKMIHAENSATALYQDERLAFCNYSKIGLLGYGTTPLKLIDELVPVFYVTTQIASLIEVLEDGYAGYGIKAKVTKGMKLAVCPIGYGDGLSKLRDVIPVIINDKEYQVLSITMSHLIIAVDNNVKVGDSVEVYGDRVKLDHMYLITGIPSAIQMTSLHTEMM
ncbi:alanine racemase [Erysipelotrichaceae bacterium OttesenSCG-928-M19]|nr:alanine racemase [Erysipelotrichaceae bacterium OttesenSCG-928-M19]